MANVRLNANARNAMANAFAALFDAAAGSPNAGYIRIYDGTQPTNGGDAITTQKLLAELRFGDPAFGSASNGTITANAIARDDSANDTGTASWARLLDGDGNFIADVDVGTSGATINLNTTSLVSGGPVEITSFTFTVPAS